MKRRTVVITLIIVVVAVGGYHYLLYWQQLGKTARLLEAMMSGEHKDGAEAMAQLGRHGVRLYRQLIVLAQSQDPDTAWRSAVLLGELGNPGAAQVLSERLSDPNATVRAAMAQALGRLRAGQAAAALGELVANEGEELIVRLSAARGLGELAGVETVPKLGQALKYQPVVAEGAVDDSWQLRIEAARALGAVGTDQAVAELAGQATSAAEPDMRVRRAIAYALGDALGSGGATEEGFSAGFDTLLEAADDEVGDVRIAAVDSLRRISPPEEQASRAESVLEEARRDPHYWVREAAGG